MILQELTRLYETLREKELVAGEGWSTAKVANCLYLSASGELVEIVSRKDKVERGKKTVLVPQTLSVPEQEKRSVNVAPNFLCDTPSYFLGVDDKGKPQRTRECFEKARELHHRVLDSCESLSAKGILRFFDTWKPATAKENEIIAQNWDELMAGGNLIFRVEGIDPLKDRAIREAWEAYLGSKAGPDAVRGQCLVTGKQNQVIAKLHPAIKGVQGAQSSGASLVSFNAPAFESYGRDGAQGLNAPVGKYAAFAYGTALNYLLADGSHRLRIGDTTVVCWARSAEAGYQDALLSCLNPEDELADSVQQALRDLTEGKPVDGAGFTLRPEETFYILGLSPNAARLSVRFFLVNRFGNVIRHLEDHQEALKIVQPFQETPKPLPLWKLVAGAGNPYTAKKEDAISHLLAGELLRAVLTGHPYPEALYRNILLRIFADGDERNENGRLTAEKIGSARAAMIKAYLLRNHKSEWEGKIKMAVNDECKEISYVLGRLFAVLETIQNAANPGITTTIKDRYFNAACATPAAVFPQLEKLSNAHLRKLAVGQRVYFEKQLGHLLGMIEVTAEGAALPKRLSLEKQGVFILGYYQEMQNRYTKKEEK